MYTILANTFWQLLKDFVKDYGCLYYQNDAMTVCPTGWKLPDNNDFNTLFDNTDARNNLANILDSSWNASSNSSGFSAVAAGGFQSPAGYLGFGSKDSN